MLGPLVKAQIVAILTKKLLDSKAFVGAVHALHGNVTRIQQGAYDTLLQATEDFDRKNPPPHLKNEAKAETHRPREDEPLKDQNAELKRLIAKMREQTKEGERK
ncbi:hypothetical protein JCM10213_005017 [Rhodosporidiobolus nylandii]